METLREKRIDPIDGADFVWFAVNVNQVMVNSVPFVYNAYK